MTENNSVNDRNRYARLLNDDPVLSARLADAGYSEVQVVRASELDSELDGSKEDRGDLLGLGMEECPFCFGHILFVFGKKTDEESVPATL